MKLMSGVFCSLFFLFFRAETQGKNLWEKKSFFHEEKEM
jgi:hypothetical protein